MKEKSVDNAVIASVKCSQGDYDDYEFQKMLQNVKKVTELSCLLHV